MTRASPFGRRSLAAALAAALSAASFVAALGQAARYVQANPEGAVDAYLRVNRSKADRALLLKIVKNPQVQFRIAPQNTFALATFMHRVGAIRHEPKTWRDYFFDDPATAQGS